MNVNKLNLTVFIFLCILTSMKASANYVNPDSNCVKMKIIFVDTTSCFLVPVSQHWGEAQYFLILCKNESGRIDSIYREYIILRIAPNQLKELHSNQGYIIVCDDMYLDLSKENVQLSIKRRFCPFLLNEPLDHIFIWHK